VEQEIERLRREIVLMQERLDEATTASERRLLQMELDSLRSQLTQMERRQQGVEEQVEYATIYITASDSERYFEPYGRGGVGDEFRRAWDSLSGFLGFLGYALIWVVVYTIVWLPVVLVARWVWRKLRG
jgi:hypothetical protein